MGRTGREEPCAHASAQARGSLQRRRPGYVAVERIQMVTHMLGTGARTAVLLHGGGLSWWNYRAVADLLAANGYRVVLPVLDGHAGSDRPFTSIEDNASELVALIDRELGGRVEALGGVSLGAQVALEALAQRPQIAGRGLPSLSAGGSPASWCARRAPWLRPCRAARSSSTLAGGTARRACGIPRSISRRSKVAHKQVFLDKKKAGENVPGTWKPS